MPNEPAMQKGAFFSFSLGYPADRPYRRHVLNAELRRTGELSSGALPGGEGGFRKRILSIPPMWHADPDFAAGLEGSMYLVIRRFRRLRSIADAARRAESGIGQLMRQSPGFRGYYVFDAGDGGGGSVTLFDTRDDALVANERALAWIQASLSDLIDGEPEITAGEVLAAVQP